MKKIDTEKLIAFLKRESEMAVKNIKTFVNEENYSAAAECKEDESIYNFLINLICCESNDVDIWEDE